LKALKRLQAEVNKVESKFYEEVHELEQKYAAQYEPFFQKVCSALSFVVLNSRNEG
jgi:nucleosome assembly protein 1-like 1